MQASTGVFQILRINPQISKTPRKAPWVKFIIQFLGEKLKKSLPNFFCGLVIHIKNTFCKKIGSKRSFQPSAVVRAIYPPSIWGPSRQLDDQHRNTNMNNKDHLVGQLTRQSPAFPTALPSTMTDFISGGGFI